MSALAVPPSRHLRPGAMLPKLPVSVYGSTCPPLFSGRRATGVRHNVYFQREAAAGLDV